MKSSLASYDFCDWSEVPPCSLPPSELLHLQLPAGWSAGAARDVQLQVVQLLTQQLVALEVWKIIRMAFDPFGFNGKPTGNNLS